MPDQPSLITIDKKLAIICERQIIQQEQQKELNQKLDRHLEKSDEQTKELISLINNADDCAKEAKSKSDTNKSEIDRLRGKSNVLDAILFVATLVLGAMGINIKP